MKVFLIAAFGSAFQEFLHHLELHQSLDPRRYRRLVRSVTYYVLTALLIALSAGVIAIAYGDQSSRLSNIEIMILGAAAPSLFKDAVKATTKRKAHAGTESESISTLVRDYFNVG